MKTIIKLLSIALMLSCIIMANFTALESRASESSGQYAHAQLLSGEDLDKAAKMALLDEDVTMLSKFLQTLNYKPQASDAVAVRATWSDKSGQHDVTGVGLAFKNNEDNATIVYVKKEEGRQTFAFTYHKSDNGTIVTTYRVNQNGFVIASPGWLACVICGLAIAAVIVCIIACGGTGPLLVPCIIACAELGGLTEPIIHACIECYDELFASVSVGGVSLPVDKFSLLAPYAVCSVLITISIGSIAVYRKKREDAEAESDEKILIR